MDESKILPYTSYAYTIIITILRMCELDNFNKYGRMEISEINLFLHKGSIKIIL